MPRSLMPDRLFRTFLYCLGHGSFLYWLANAHTVSFAFYWLAISAYAFLAVIADAHVRTGHA